MDVSPALLVDRVLQTRQDQTAQEAQILVMKKRHGHAGVGFGGAAERGGGESAAGRQWTGGDAGQYDGVMPGS